MTRHTPEDKKQLRIQLRRLRRSLSAEAIDHNSRLIFERLQTFPPFIAVRSIVIYAADENEVQTESIWELAVKQDKAVYYPRITPDHNNLEFVRRQPETALIPGTFGIRIPSGHDLLRQGRGETVVLTPGVGFDVSGNRLGRGKGYYDRAFRGVLSGLLRVAIAYDFQVVVTIPNGPQDERVDWIVTESRLIDCRQTGTPKTAV